MTKLWKSDCKKIQVAAQCNSLLKQVQLYLLIYTTNYFKMLIKSNILPDAMPVVR